MYIRLLMGKRVHIVEYKLHITFMHEIIHIVMPLSRKNSDFDRGGRSTSILKVEVMNYIYYRYSNEVFFCVSLLVLP